jgi:predicted nuclease of predicted toxin-antitoxin system
MSLRFFADHCVPNSIIRFFREQGFEVLVLREFIPMDSPDPVVIDKAQECGAILLTLNGDFADLINYPPQMYKGIISIQLKSRPENIPAICERLGRLFDMHHEMNDFKGKLYVVEAHRMRVRG